MAHCKDKQSNTNSSLKGKIADRVRDTDTDTMFTLIMRSKLSVCSIYFLFFHVKYALQYTFVCEELENFLGRGKSLPRPLPPGRGKLHPRPLPRWLLQSLNFRASGAHAPRLRLTPQNPRPWEVEVGGEGHWANLFLWNWRGIDAPAQTSHLGWEASNMQLYYRST